MGSGSTGIACKNLNRNFVGIEKEKEYFQISQARLDTKEEQ
jgi:site-specific DNA-methyltransferase (adenine-specific)